MFERRTGAGEVNLDPNYKSGLLRSGIVVILLWLSYWGYETVMAGKLWFSLVETFGIDSGVAQQAYAEREFAKKMAIGGPVVGIIGFFVARWVYLGFRRD